MNTSFQVYTFIKQVAILFPTFVTLFTFRGFFQALAAHIAGDETPRDEGFLTLNPLAHVDVLGALSLSMLFAVFQDKAASGNYLVSLFLIMIVVSIGVRPYYPVPIDSSQFRWPRLGVALTTLSGTVSYLLLTLMSMYALLIGFDIFGNDAPGFLVVQQIASSIIEWAMVWAVLSLIPIPPFDAAALLPVFFGELGQKIYDFLEPYGLFIFMGLLFLPGVKEVFWSVLHVIQFALYVGLTKLIFI